MICAHCKQPMKEYEMGGTFSFALKNGTKDVEGPMHTECFQEYTRK